jgi:hypothetical protein
MRLAGARLARTHADLVANARMDLAAAFFLTDIYGSEDLSRLDVNVRRVVPAMKLVLPAAGLEIVAQAIELEALSEDLDFAMARVLGAEANELSRAATEPRIARSTVAPIASGRSNS